MDARLGDPIAVILDLGFQQSLIDEQGYPAVTCIRMLEYVCDLFQDDPVCGDFN